MRRYSCEEEINLLYFLINMFDDCLIYLGEYKGDIVIDNFKKRFGFGGILDCENIYEAIQSENTNRLPPKKVIEIFREKGWLDE